MSENSWLRILISLSANPKSAIQNRKWLGLSVIPFVLVVAAVGAQAQQPTKIPRIGYLTNSALSADPKSREAFRQGLRDLGYVEGKNIVIEWRSSEGKRDRQRALAAELVRLKVDVIVAIGSGDILTAKEATTTIPIVMVQGGDAVGSGFVASLARPGGNITGLATLRPELSGKRLELLKEIIPKLSRVAVFGSSDRAGLHANIKGDRTRRWGARSETPIPGHPKSTTISRPHSKPQPMGGLRRFLSSCRGPSSLLIEQRLQNSR